MGIVVPTLGKRPQYLTACLTSIRRSGSVYISLVTPKQLLGDEMLQVGLVDKVIADPGNGLAAAINLGIVSMPGQIEYVNWLGDDDLLTDNSIDLAAYELEIDPKTVMVFGSCLYIDENSNPIFLNKSGSWAVPLMRFGPDLIPQPGALFRRDAFNKVNGLSTDLNWAFDFDLFIKLTKTGKIRYLNQTLSNFRWHENSLSVSGRYQSALEASQVRKKYLPNSLKLVSALWEYPVQSATIIAANLVSRKVRKIKG